jgi:uncharacterized protein YutE (UPF0331/DUF86 family)
MADRVILNKADSIERCLKRIREDYQGQEEAFRSEYMRQDAIILNLQRACEQSIDLANHLVKEQKAGIPQTSKAAFELLVKAGILEEALGERLSKMVGFRNVAVHQYQEMDLDIVTTIIEKHLDDFRTFVRVALQFA